MNKKGRVIWITGLSGAGKTTVARALLPHFSNQAVLLDGDDLRDVLGVSNDSFDTLGRKKLAQTYANLAGLLANQGLTVIVATISLFHDIHTWNRNHLPGYLEIFLDVPIEECRHRDNKGVYSTTGHTKTQPVAGIETPVELPLQPHLTFSPRENEGQLVSITWIVEKILTHLSGTSE